MRESGTRRPRGGRNWARIVGWGAAAALLLLPLVAMQFTSEVDWTAGDFLFAGLLIGGVGLAVEMAVRISRSGWYRSGAALGLAAGFFLIWANAAVGYIGDEDNAYNLLFFAVVGVALVGALIARFRAEGMALAMLAAGLVQAAVGLGGAAADPVTAPITFAFVAMWLGSAALFRNAAREAAGAQG